MLPSTIATGSSFGDTSDFCAAKSLDAAREIVNTSRQSNDRINFISDPLDMCQRKVKSSSLLENHFTDTAIVDTATRPNIAGGIRIGIRGGH